jgi:hypothetical protein
LAVAARTTWNPTVSRAIKSEGLCFQHQGHGFDLLAQGLIMKIGQNADDLAPSDLNHPNIGFNLRDLFGEIRH